MDILKSVMARLGGSGAVNGGNEEALRAALAGAGSGVEGYQEGVSDEFVDDTRAIPADFPEDFISKRDQVISLTVDGLEGSMKPLFAHQVFARDIYILGFKGLSVHFSYTKRWRALCEIKFEAEMAGEERLRWGELLDLELMSTILKSPVYPLTHSATCFTTERSTFDKWLVEDRAGGSGADLPSPPLEKAKANGMAEQQQGPTPVPWCVKGTEYSSQGETGLRLIRCDGLHANTAGQTFLHRVQAMSVWFIESAEQTDAEDWRWGVYAALDDDTLVGFTSVFTFCNPLRDTRPLGKRICQSVVLPLAQKRGIGRAMVEKIYHDVLDNPKCFEMTVEDPCLAFTRMRDCIEVELMAASGSSSCLVSKKEEGEMLLPGSKLVYYENGIVPLEKALQVQEQIKITLKQVQRCYELLRLCGLRSASTAESHRDFCTFRLDIKRRMYIENLEGVQQRPKEELKENLRLLYQDLEEQYVSVLEKLPGLESFYKK